MENRKYKLLNYEVVASVAKSIASSTGYVTTLEVKNTLRSDGYFALQSEVSFFMAELVESFEPWDYYCNGIFRVYFLPEIIFELGSFLPASKN